MRWADSGNQHEDEHENGHDGGDRDENVSARRAVAPQRIAILKRAFVAANVNLAEDPDFYATLEVAFRLLFSYVVPFLCLSVTLSVSSLSVSLFFFLPLFISLHTGRHRRRVCQSRGRRQEGKGAPGQRRWHCCRRIPPSRDRRYGKELGEAAMVGI